MLKKNFKYQIAALLFATIIVTSTITHLYPFNNIETQNNTKKQRDENQNYVKNIITPDLTNISETEPYKYDPIGTNVIILINQSLIDLVNEIFSGKEIIPIICFDKNDFFNKIEKNPIDIIIILSLTEKLTIEEFKLLEYLVGNGKILIGSSNCLDYNPDLASLFGIEDFIQIPNYLINSTVISDYYIIKDYINKVLSINGGGTLFIPSNSSLILAQYDKWNPPVLKLSIVCDKNFTTSNNDIKIQLKLKNIGWSDAYNVKVQQFLNSFSIISSNYEYYTESNFVTWNIKSIKINEEIELNFTLKAPAVNNKQIFTMKTDVYYSDIDDRSYFYPEINLLSYLNVEIFEPILKIEVFAAKILAWVGDDSDNFFISAVLDDSYIVDKVSEINILMEKLQDNEYDILWLMNFGWIDFPQNLTYSAIHNWIKKMACFYLEFGEPEAKIINEWVKKGGKIISSDWALKTFQYSLNEIYGISHIGGFPLPFVDFNFKSICSNHLCNNCSNCLCSNQTLFEEMKASWDWYHKIELSENHTINNGYLGKTLKSKSWAFNVYYYSWIQRLFNPNAGEPTTIAYFQNPFGDFFPNSPAIVASTYYEGKGVYFAADIGSSAYKGYNTSAWIKIAKNSINWLNYEDITPIEPIFFNYTFLPSYISHIWLERYINTNLPSITVFSFNKGRSLFFSYKTETLNSKVFQNIIYKMCFRTIVLEDTEGFIFKKGENLSKQYKFIGKGPYIMYLESLNCDEYNTLTYLDGIQINPFILPTNFTYIPIELKRGGIHTIDFIFNESINDNNTYQINQISVQSSTLLLDNTPIFNCYSKNFYFKGGGFISILYNSSGEDINVYVDKVQLDFVNCSDYTIFRSNRYLKFGLHQILINGTQQFNISSIAAFYDIDLDMDGLLYFEEYVYNSDPIIQTPWILWQSLTADFYLNNTIRDYYFNYTGKAFIYIPNEFVGNALYMRVVTLIGEIKEINLNNITICDSVISPTTFLLWEKLGPGYQYLSFIYEESSQGCFFNVQFFVNKTKLKDLYNIEITDSDGDSLNDISEITSILHPFNPDCDGDKAFDGLDNNPTLYNVLPGNSPQSYLMPIFNNSYTTKILVQIQVPKTNYQCDNLPWDNGTINIIPMIRIFGPQTYEENGKSFVGDSLPNDTVSNTYISLTPFVAISEYSWISAVYYRPEHPAFNDSEIKFTFDVVWVALNNRTDGSIIPIHLWVHPEDIIIQSIAKTEIGPVDFAFVIIKGNSSGYYNAIRYQIGDYNNYTLQLPPELTNKTEYILTRNVEYLESQILINNTIEGIIEKLNESSEIIQSVITKALTATLCDFAEKTIVSIKSDVLLQIIKSGSKIKMVLKDIDSFFTYREMTLGDKVLIETIDNFDEVIEYGKVTYLFHIQNKVLKSQSTEAFETWIEVHEFYDSNKGGLKYAYIIKNGAEGLGSTDKMCSMQSEEIGDFLKQQYPYLSDQIDDIFSKNSDEKVGFLKRIYNYLKRGIIWLGSKINVLLSSIPGWTKLIDTLKEVGSKIKSWYQDLITKIGHLSTRWKNVLKYGAAIIQIITVFLDILDIIEYIQLLCMLTQGTPIIVPILIRLLIALQIVSIVLDIIEIGVLFGVLASTAATSAASVYGLVVTLAIVVIMVILWLIKPQNVDYEIIQEGSLKPQTWFDDATIKKYRYQLSPEVGANLYVKIHVLNKITGEAQLTTFAGFLSFGENSIGPFSTMYKIDPNTEIKIGELPLLPGETGQIIFNAPCQTWGPQKDAFLIILYDFHDDWIQGPLLMIIPLDCDVDIFPTTVAEFINGLTPERITVKEAVSVHMVTSGHLNPTFKDVWGTWIDTDGVSVSFSDATLTNWQLNNFIDADSDAKDAWAFGFVPKDSLKYIRLQYVDTDGIKDIFGQQQETFWLKKLTVTYNGNSFTPYDAGEANGIRVGTTNFEATGYLNAVFSCSESSACWRPDLSTVYP